MANNSHKSTLREDISSLSSHFFVLFSQFSCHLLCDLQLLDSSSSSSSSSSYYYYYYYQFEHLQMRIGISISN